MAETESRNAKYVKVFDNIVSIQKCSMRSWRCVRARVIYALIQKLFNGCYTQHPYK